MRAFLIAFFACVALVQADTALTVNINPSTQVGGAGGVVPFFGTLHNNTTDTVFVNGDSFTFDIAGALDDSPFLPNAPISIDAGVTTTSFEFFAITVPQGVTFGVFNGQFTVLGGADGNAQDNLGQASFALSVPEPGGAGLLACALALCILQRRSKRQLAA